MKTMEKWISVKDRLPEHLERVLVAMDCDGHIMMASSHVLAGGHNFAIYWADGRGPSGNREITHWMPLPEPPK